MQSDLFADANTIAVTQTKEWGEILTGTERRNRFSLDFDGMAGALLAVEQGSGWPLFFLGSMRSYTLAVQTREGKPVLRMHSPFRIVGRQVSVMASDGKLLGTVRRRLSLVRTRYDVFDARPAPLFEITRGFVKRWTFTTSRNGAEVAVIVKRWTRPVLAQLKNEARFELQFPAVHAPAERALLLAALFLIDFQHFEESGGE